MSFKQLGRTNVKLPTIGMGTWEIGGERERDDSHDKESIAAIRKAIELGIHLIDTAELYGDGHCEEVVGEAIKPFSREELFIVSKVWHNHLHHDDVIKAAENSLKRLQTDWIDLYLIHWPNPEVPLIETMQALEKLVERKLIRFIGVSNFDISEVEEANRLAKTFIIDGVGYDLFPMSWERLDRIVNLDEDNASCVDDAEILYYRKEEDKKHFLELQTKLQANHLFQL